jgi:hypothetical protein
MKENDRLRDALRRGDPAADGRDFSRAETEAMRRVVLGGAHGRPAHLPGWPWAAAAALALLVAAGFVVSRWLSSGAAPEPPGAVRLERPALPARPRQVRFTTANGTQIIWTLDPNFEL